MARKMVVIVIVALLLLVGGVAMSLAGQGARASPEDGNHFLAMSMAKQPSSNGWKTVQSDGMTPISGVNVRLGLVSVWNDNKYLYVQVNTYADWSIMSFQAAAVSSPSEMPSLYTASNPDVPDTYTADQNVRTATVKIPLTWEKGTQLYIGTLAGVVSMDGVEMYGEAGHDYYYPSAGEPGVPFDYFGYTVTGSRSR